MYLDNSFTRASFEDPGIVDIYRRAAGRTGLWKSEEYFYTKYFSKQDRILDIGCGCGRTTFALYRLGYENVHGIDLSSNMIDCARMIARKKRIAVGFEVADACELPFEDASFDGALFSFNGLMHIPQRRMRIRAMNEVNRILKQRGVFVFVTQSRDDPDFKWFWEEETQRWSSHNQDDRLTEFGDVIFTKRRRQIFLHVPSLEEIFECLEETGFELAQYIRKSEICRGLGKSGRNECVFWAAIKG